MNTGPGLFAVIVGTLAMGGFPAAGFADGEDRGNHSYPADLEGSWIVTVRPIFCTGSTAGIPGTDVPGIVPVKSHMTFGRGGSVVEETSNPNLGVGSRTGANGVWERTGRTSYQFAMQAFLVEPRAPYQSGMQRIVQTLELHTPDEWTSSGTVQFYATFDLNESPGLAPYRAGCARSTGVRMR